MLVGARSRGERDVEVWTRTHLGRIALLRGELDEAVLLLEEAAAGAGAAGMASYAPFPLGFLGLALVARGDLDDARESLERGLAVGLQVEDTCWQAIDLAGLGRLAAAHGDTRSAIETLEEARRRVVRGPTISCWLLAFVSDALCTVAVADRTPGARRWVADLEALAARTGMRDLLARAHLHRHALGEGSALAAAALVAADVECAGARAGDRGARRRRRLTLFGFRAAPRGGSRPGHRGRRTGQPSGRPWHRSNRMGCQRASDRSGRPGARAAHPREAPMAERRI